jgi:hypothetical protein
MYCVSQINSHDDVTNMS